MMNRPRQTSAIASRPSAEDARQLVALRVEAEGHGILTYAFRDADGAAEMVAFLRGILPRARFTIQPAYH